MPLSRGKSLKRNGGVKGVSNAQNSRISSQPGAEDALNSERIVTSTSSRCVGSRKRNFQPNTTSDGEIWEPPRTRSRSALLAATANQNGLIASGNVVVNRSTLASPNTSAYRRSPVPAVPAELVWADTTRSPLFAAPKDTLQSILKGSKIDRSRTARTLVVADSTLRGATLIESGADEFSNEPFTFDAGDSSSSSSLGLSSSSGPVSFAGQSLGVGSFPAMCCVDGSGSHNCQLNRLPVPPIVADRETSTTPAATSSTSVSSATESARVNDMPSTSANRPASRQPAQMKSNREKSSNGPGANTAATVAPSSSEVRPTGTTRGANVEPTAENQRSHPSRSDHSYRQRYYNPTSDATPPVHPYHMQNSNGFPFNFTQAAHQSGLPNYPAHFNVHPQSVPAWLGIPGFFYGSQSFFQHPSNSQTEPRFAHIPQQYRRSVDMVAHSVNALNSIDAVLQSGEPFRMLLGSLVSIQHSMQDFVEASMVHVTERLGQRNPRGLSRPEICTLPSWRWRVTDSVKGESQTSCVVCMCDFEPRQLVRALTCHHVFHSKCVDKWLKTNRTCPICRSESVPQSQNG